MFKPRWPMLMKLTCLWVLALSTVLLVPHPAHAQEHYTLSDNGWKKQETLDPNSPEGQLQAIRKLIAEGQGDDAWDAADDWIDHHPNHRLLVEAYLIRADAKVAAGNEFKALFDYEYLIRQWPGTEQFNVALEREFEIAKLYSAGRYRKFLGMRIFEATGEAEEIYIRIQERSPGSAIGEKASMALGDHYFDNGDMKGAREAYSLFLVNYPRSVLRERAMLRTIQADLATFKGPRFDATGLLDASTRIRQFKREFPTSAERIGSDAILVRIDESLALKTYLNARWFVIRDEKVSAIAMLQRVIHDHPQTAAAQLSIADLKSMGAPVVAVDGSQTPSDQSTPGPETIKIPEGSPDTQPADGAKTQKAEP